MRFHLPAFLIADIKEELEFHFIFHLTELTDYGKSQLSLLSSDQRAVIRRYLLWLKNKPDYWVDQERVERSLETYW